MKSILNVQVNNLKCKPKTTFKRSFHTKISFKQENFALSIWSFLYTKLIKKSKVFKKKSKKFKECIKMKTSNSQIKGLNFKVLHSNMVNNASHRNPYLFLTGTLYSFKKIKSKS